MNELLKGLPKQNISVSYIERILPTFNDEASRTTSVQKQPLPLQPFEYSDRQNEVSGSSVRRTTPDGEQAWIVESLTNREIEVLELLGQKLYNKEIAEQMAVSLETVKSHLKNIYQKLNVKGRRQAVVKARELGILSSQE